MIGLEDTFDEHLEGLVAVFREVRRVLRKDGTLWLNYGDAYAANRGYQVPDNKHRPVGNARGATVPPSMKPKDLMEMPSDVARALRGDGWWLRSRIPWIKENPMPESAGDRPTSAVEYWFLMTKAKNYFYDAAAVRTPFAESSVKRLSQPTFDMQEGGPKDAKAGNRSHRRVLENLHRRVPASWATAEGYESQDPRYPKREAKQDGHGRRHAGFNERWEKEKRNRGEPPYHEQYETGHQTLDDAPRGGANMRNYIITPIYPYKGAHFATFPPKVIEPWVKAGTSEHGASPACGAPWVRMSEKEMVSQHGQNRAEAYTPRDDFDGAKGLAQSGHVPARFKTTTTGWAPSCECDAGDPVPCTVLDPFAGSGTVGMVADRMGRDAVLIEISEEYAAMARKRIEADASERTLDMFAATPPTPLFADPEE